MYTDGSKTGVGAYVTNNKIVSKQYNETSPQIVECLVVLEVLKAFPGPLNIVSDSSYVVNAVKSLIFFKKYRLFYYIGDFLFISPMLEHIQVSLGPYPEAMISQTEPPGLWLLPFHPKWMLQEIFTNNSM